MKKISLLVSIWCFLLTSTSNAQVGQRWYSYADYVSYTYPSYGLALMDIWNDTTAIFGYPGTPVSYFGNNFTSTGMSFAPRLAAWDNTAFAGSTIKVGPSDVFTIDSIRLSGSYMRNNAKPAVKDTIILGLVYGNGAITTNLPEYSLTAPSYGTIYGYSPINFLNMTHDSLNNRAGSYTGVATPPYIQKIVLTTGDTSSSFYRAYALTTPFTVTAAQCASMSVSFKTGDPTYTPGDTIRYGSGSFKYGLFDPLIIYNGTPGSPSYAIYDPTDSNVGYFKPEGSTDAGWGGQYIPTWTWTSGGGAAELQYPAYDFHINCVTCDLNDSIAGTLTLCPGTTTPLSFSLPGGTWSSSTLGVATVNSSTGLVYGVSGGTTTITYDLSGHHSYITVTVDAPASITGVPAFACAGTTFTLTGTPFPGTWTSGSTSVATVNLITGTVGAETAGTTVITYAPASGCPGTAVVSVRATPAAITGTTNVCTGATITLSDITGGGTWSSVSPGIATVSGGGTTATVGGVAAGTDIVSYTVAGCAATTTVTVNSSPIAGVLTGPSTVCAGSSITLLASVGGGTWSSSSTSVATVTGTGVVNGAAAGSTTISYTVTNSCGSAHATAPITVEPAPLPITGTTTVCVGATTTLSDGTGGGTWSSGTTSIATAGATTGVIGGVSPGTSTISYTVSGCSTTTSVVVSTTPSAGSVTGVSSLCVGATTTLTDPVAGGTWSSTSTGVATVSGTGVVGGVATGSSTISYTVSNSCGSASATSTITVGPAPNAGTITGTATLCPGFSLSLTDAATGGTWSSGTPSVATVDGSGNVYGVGTSGGSSTITYTVTNACGSATATFPVTVISESLCAENVTATPVSGNEIQVFPNPNKGFFTMNLLSANEEQAHVIITNLVGEKVSEFTTTTNKLVDINLNKTAGIYFLSATTSTGKYVVKIVVE